MISLRDFGDGPVLNRRETARRSYGNHAVIVQSPQPRIEIARISYGARGARADSVRRPRGYRTVVIRSLCSFGHSCTKRVQLLISD